MLQRTKEVGESFNLGVSTLSRVCQECNFVFTTEIGENRKRRLAGWDDDLETLDLTCTKLEVCRAFESRDRKRDLGVMCIELKSPEKSKQSIRKRGGGRHGTSLRRND